MEVLKKEINGHCPKIGGNYTITVEYIKDGSVWKQHLASCFGNMQHDCPYEKACPVRALAPKYITR